MWSGLSSYFSHGLWSWRLAPLKICRRGQSMLWPPKNDRFCHSKLLLEMVTTFTYKPSLVRIDACNFELSWWQTHKQTNTQTDRGDCNTLRRSFASAQCDEFTEQKNISAYIETTDRRLVEDTTDQWHRRIHATFEPILAVIQVCQNVVNCNNLRRISCQIVHLI